MKLFKCFDPITGGRVSGIVRQESPKLCGGKKGKDGLPSVRNDDKVEEFCDTYKNFIDVPGSFAEFAGHWARAKAKVEATNGSYLLSQLS